MSSADWNQNRSTVRLGYLLTWKRICSVKKACETDDSTRQCKESVTLNTVSLTGPSAISFHLLVNTCSKPIPSNYRSSCFIRLSADLVLFDLKAQKDMKWYDKLYWQVCCTKNVAGLCNVWVSVLDPLKSPLVLTLLRLVTTLSIQSEWNFKSI